jgi:hypothetical protein
MKVQTNVKAGIRDVSGGIGNNVVTNTTTTGSVVEITDNSVRNPAPV